MTMDSMTEWIVFVPDVEGSLETRMKVRDIHIKEMMKHIESGLYQMGGATLNGPDIAGSAIIVRAETTQEIMDVLSQDVYARSGVWDLSRVQMIPFICVYRLAHVNEKVMGDSAKYLQEGKKSVNKILE